MKVAVWATTALMSWLVAVAAAQPAPVQVTCEFYEIGASNDKAAAIDPGFPPILAKRLQRPAFKQWNAFKLMSKNEKTLAKKKPEKFSLKDGGATAELVEVVDKSKSRMNVSLEDGKGKTVAEARQLVDAGDWVIVVHVANSNDGHLLAGTCK